MIGEVSQQHRVATMSTLRIAFMSSAALELLASISVAIVAVTVGLRLTHGSMTLQAGLLAILLAPEAYWPIRRVGAEFHAAADGAEAIDGILAELDAEASPRPSTWARRSGSLLSHVAYTYPEATSPVLVGVHLDAGPGLTAVTGPSGVGKSTLLELAAGLRTPTAGTVRAGRAHLVTQRPFLPAGTLRDALVLGNGADDQAVWDALRLVGLEGFVAEPAAGARDPARRRRVRAVGRAARAHRPGPGHPVHRAGAARRRADRAPRRRRRRPGARRARRPRPSGAPSSW